MMQFDRMALGRQAKELGFVRDTFEKVCRLADVLKFFEGDDLLSEYLALKGGTAINLTILDLPRLSVDIDLDFSKNMPREEMLEVREMLSSRISKYMEANGYRLSPKSKNHHALDSFVYEYQNAGGMKDNLKIEINYMLRCHVLPVVRRKVYLPWMTDELTVLSVDPIEIFGAKIVALLTRTATRDLYDVHNMITHELFDESQLDMLRKCVVFYSAIGGEHPPKEFAIENVGKVTKRSIITDLYPVLRHGERFELTAVQNEVRTYLSGFLNPTKEEQIFWSAFEKGIYEPQFVFEGAELQRIKEHPMALWKCRSKEQNIKTEPVKGRVR
ncbi:MAG: nucleotidyl transferase AbiEii/AbiGii toxin family protein [Lachnospiraceae bacterium]|nr:nucleotidyl transferase AbiEii/AbiGii toxin family protein [Lachnospiraceae bacterium]